MSLTTLFRLVSDAGNVRSVNFFNGRLLSAEDLTREQAASAEQRRRLGRALGDGVAFGLEVTRAPAAPTARNGNVIFSILLVEPGLAVAPDGRTLFLPSPTAVSLVEGGAGAAPSDAVSPSGRCGVAGAFAACDEALAGNFATGEGVYVLTLAAATGAEGRAPTSGLHKIAAPCNTKFVVEAVMFRLVRYPFGNADPLGGVSPTLRRGRLAAFCFGLEAGSDPAAAPDDPLPKTLLRIGMEEKLRTEGLLSDCEVPLAVLYWETAAQPSQGVTFVDTWAVRRRVTLPYPPGLFDPLLAGRRFAESEAVLFQFQDHLDAVAKAAGATPPTVRAADHFAFLPPAGFLPVGTGRFDPDTFFTGFTDLEKIAADPAFGRHYLHNALFAEPIRVVAADVPLLILRFDDAPGYVMFLRQPRSYAPPTPGPQVTPGGTTSPPSTSPGPSPAKTAAFTVKVYGLGIGSGKITVWAQDESGRPYPGVQESTGVVQMAEAKAALEEYRMRHGQGVGQGGYGYRLESDDPLGYSGVGGATSSGATPPGPATGTATPPLSSNPTIHQQQLQAMAIQQQTAGAGPGATGTTYQIAFPTFRIFNLPPGRYFVKAQAPGYQTDSVEQILGEGQTRVVYLTLVDLRDPEAPRRGVILDNFRDWIGRPWEKLVVVGDLPHIVGRGPWPPWTDPGNIDPRPDEAETLNGLLQGFIDHDPLLPLAVRGQDPKVIIRRDYSPATVSDGPYAYLVSGSAAIPVVLVPGELALPKSVPASQSGVPEITAEAAAGPLAKAGAGDLDVAASLWSEALGKILHLPPAAARGVLSDMRAAVPSIREGRGYYAGMPANLSDALRKKKVTDEQLANVSDVGKFLNYLELGSADQASLAGYTGRLIEQAREVVPASGWSLSAGGLGLKAPQIAALDAHGIKTKGDFQLETDTHAGVNKVAGMMGASADEVRAVRNSIEVDLGVIRAASAADSGVLSLSRVDEARATTMVAAGYDSLTKVADADPDALAAALNITRDDAAAITKDALGKVLRSSGVLAPAEVDTLLEKPEITNLSDVATKSDVVTAAVGAAGKPLGNLANVIRSGRGTGTFHSGGPAGGAPGTGAGFGGGFGGFG